ncbi:MULTISPECIES: MarR family winged helix-turn-helix transcriptional regulator [Bacillus]|uniref:MarR family winged helix-turn-helix transcriptional regulator n=1 Tax=Bacillus TaxID=1386 RepID=UPI0002EAC1AD|nr:MULTISPECIES: MarR family transcriptional regulator [Bacillus]
MDLFSTVYRFNKWYVIRLQEICSVSGITPVQWLALYHVSLNEGCTSKDITNEWSVEKPTVSYVIRKLNEQGFLKFTSGEDKRQKYLSLTKEGRILCEEINVKVIELQNFVTEPFTEEKVNDWTKQLEVLGKRMQQYEPHHTNK